MSSPKERFSNFVTNDEGDIVPLEDTPYDELPASNAFRAQGLANLERMQHEEALIEEDERTQKQLREQTVADAALRNAGVYVTLEQHRRNQLELVDIASDISMYRGGEKGGYQTDDFQERYVPKAADVEQGARINHKKRVNHDLPRIYMASELKAAGFSPYDVDDDVTQMRSQLMSRYGGPQNKKARADWRARLKQ